MSKELPSTNSEIFDLETLSPQTKMRMILEVFNSGKGTSEEKGRRKQNFIDLIGDYNKASIKAVPSESSTHITNSDSNKKRIHNQIMEIIRSVSLSKDVKAETRKLAEYLVHNRNEVERMVTSYFLGHDTAPNPVTYSPVRQARENPMYFSKPGGDEN